MLQLTSRDEAMLDWMNVVRLADVEAIRWALLAYQDDHDGRPASIRPANHWIARMAELGYLGRARPMYRDRQIVWPTHRATGRAAPTLFRQTMRHELAVAHVAGRYLAAGFVWSRDRRPQGLRDHQADGVARRGDEADLVEVELTPKKSARYQLIQLDHGARLSAGEVGRVIYFCTTEADVVVRREADKVLFRDERMKFISVPSFDRQGRWAPQHHSEPALPPWRSRGRVGPVDSAD